MHEKDSAAAEGRALVSNKAMEIVVALLLLGGSAIVITDTIRVGFGWQEGVGPAPGYFPFWVAVIMGASSLIILVATIVKPGDGETFVSVALLGGISVGPVTVPGIGIYVSSALFICFFMLAIGRQGVLKSILVSIGVPLLLFFMFEKWFLVPLPKGPLEAFLLGY